VELLSASSILEAHLASFIACFIVIVFVALPAFFVAASPFFILNHLVSADSLFVLLFWFNLVTSFP